MRYLITGGTGSLGTHLVEYLTQYSDTDVIVFSRDEQKQFNMKGCHKDKENIHYVLGDVRDYETVDETFAQYKPDVVIHTAAQKHVQECDTNPMQAVKTNIEGTKNVGKACIRNNVKAACLISTDKALQPTTLYGMTKYIAERLWVNFEKYQKITKFTGVRYGNILNSAGSLLPLYQKIALNSNCPEFPLTSTEMTRFFMSYSSAISLIMQSLSPAYLPFDLNYEKLALITRIKEVDAHMFYIPVAIAAKIVDIAEIFAEDYNGTVIHKDIVEGEKTHEILLPDYSSKDNIVDKHTCRKFLQRNGIIK